MFAVSEADAAAMRAVVEAEGEVSAAIELRRRLPAVTENAEARECAQTIADGSRSCCRFGSRRNDGGRKDRPAFVARLDPTRNSPA